MIQSDLYLQLLVETCNIHIYQTRSSLLNQNNLGQVSITKMPNLTDICPKKKKISHQPLHAR